MLDEQFMFMMQGGFTKRFHTAPTIREHTVGHHSFGVACICYLLADAAPSAALLMAALCHDLAEQHVGDVPSPTKRAIPALKEQLDNYENEVLARHELKFFLTDREISILKMADILDGMWNCCIERKLGNQAIAPAYTNFRSYAMGVMPAKECPELDIFNKIEEVWRNANGVK